MLSGFNPVQAMLDHDFAEQKKKRAEGQMTLGKLIEALEGLNPERKVVGLGQLDSYRGYYEDLAFGPDETPRTVGDLLAECKKAMGRYFTGYKGGEFLMGEDTPLWVSAYGDASGLKLMRLHTESDPIQPVMEQEEW